jgi:hypothetical protein
MIVSFQIDNLQKDLKNLVNYSIGFLDGVEEAKPVIMDNLGKSVIESLKNFIDTNARISPESLHHVYEWYQTGSPEARLFDVDYLVVGKNSLSFNYTFSQSTSFSNNSTEPFYDKANIMENGIPVIIKPKPNGVLRFEKDGEVVFTKKPTLVSRPGGDRVAGSFEETLKAFFESYFTQSYIMTSGMTEHFNNPRPYKDNLSSGIKGGGKGLGFKVGYRWAAKGGKIE